MAETATETKETVELTKSPEPKASPTQTPKSGEWVDAFIKGEVGKEEPPKTAEAKVEAKNDPVTEVPKQADVKTEEKPKVEAKAETKPDTKIDKQLKDTRDFATRVQQQNVELGRKLEGALKEMHDLKAKMDGTYEEPKGPDPKEIELKAVNNTKLATSHYAAIEVLKAQGMDEQQAEEEMQKLIWRDDAPYQELQRDPAINARVLNAKLPLVEALKVVKEAEARKQYGDGPEAMRAAIEKQLKSDFDKQLEHAKEEARRAAIDELKHGGKPKRETVAGLSGVRGATKEEGTQSEQTLNFESLFGPVPTKPR